MAIPQIFPHKKCRSVCRRIDTAKLGEQRVNQPRNQAWIHSQPVAGRQSINSELTFPDVDEVLHTGLPGPRPSRLPCPAQLDDDLPAGWPSDTGGRSTRSVVTFWVVRVEGLHDICCRWHWWMGNCQFPRRGEGRCQRTAWAHRKRRSFAVCYLTRDANSSSPKASFQSSRMTE